MVKYGNLLEKIGFGKLEWTILEFCGTTYGTGDATYAHHYNYPLGRVVFDTAVSTTSAVKLEYSYRNVQTYIADQAPWWDEIQQESR
jgi:hypothetical protein